MLARSYIGQSYQHSDGAATVKRTCCHVWVFTQSANFHIKTKASLPFSKEQPESLALFIYRHVVQAEWQVLLCT